MSLKKSVLILLTFSLGGGLFYINSNYFKNSILIESEESKTQHLTSVFNRIKWISTPKKDIWMMNQSHYGLHAADEKWERLAIVIDKTTTPKTARYYQLESGPLEWSEALVNKRTPYRASCFTCHSNGPRAIRPMTGSTTLADKLKVFAWNIRIKTYGRIHYDKTHDIEDKTFFPPFHLTGNQENKELKVATCIKCHKEEGLFSRGTLVLQQLGTIQTLVNNGHMPPPGFSLSPLEKKQLRDFLRGF